MLKVKDLSDDKEYKFEDKWGVTLFAIGENFMGDIVIVGTIEANCGELFIAEWDLTGELYRASSDLDGCKDLDLIPVIELKPCPFCNSDNLKTMTTSDIGNWSVECLCCNTFTNTYTKDKREAFKKWNRRA